MSSEKDKDQPALDRIRFQDEESGQPRGRKLAVSDKRDRSAHRRKTRSLSREPSAGRADPSLALPITYRTVSFQIEESKGKDQAVLQKAKQTAAKDLNDLEWHTLSVDDLLQRLSTSSTTGLSAEQVKRRQIEYGRNTPSPPETFWIKTIFGYFFKGFGSILLVGSILVFVSWKPLGNPPAVANLALAIVLLCVFFIQAGFNMFQDWSTTRVMSSIKHMIPEDCEVLRDGIMLSLPAAQLVPGDVVSVKAGNKLPADLRFIQVSSEVKFDRSVLTGESRPVAAAVDHTDTNYLETFNIGLQGTHCLLGSCVGIVVAIGDKTVFGRIATLTNEPKSKMTTLERELLYFVAIICTIMATIVTIVIIVWATWLRKDHPDWIDVPTLIVSCVSVGVAFIPEGLPIALTAALTITAKLMQKNKILCKSLKTVETLGSVSVLCSDKTGTLTEGKMTVTDCAFGTQSMSADEAMSPIPFSRATSSALDQLRSMASLCNAANLDAVDADKPIAERKVFGDATDQAVLRFSEQLRAGSVSYLRAGWERTYELAFNSKNKYMIQCFRSVKTELLKVTFCPFEADRFSERDTLLTIKGAPDVLIGRCTQYVTETGSIESLEADTILRIEKMKDGYSSQGKRCLLLARKVVPENEVTGSPGTLTYESSMTAAATSGLVLVALVAIVDPLRPEIQDVVSTLHTAGIRIAMVTGDFALTALAIARDAGIVTSTTVDGVSALSRNPAIDSESLKHEEGQKNAIVLSGPELTTLNEHQWARLTQYKETVFARTTPEQKLRIVREYQRNNVVAMTGDGVNDAPSLKAADVGISLGSGSDIAMEAADMVLLESFSSFVPAIRYGRVVFDNLKKVISYLLPAGSFAEFWPIITSILFGLPQILSSFLMIIICCFTDCAAATMLSYEKAEADVLTRPPRNIKKDRLVNWQLILQSYGLIGIIQTFTSFAMSYWYLERQGIPFRDLWFGFGKVPEGIDENYYQRKINEASSIYFVNLVVMQWFNLMTTRTRRLSIFQHPPLFKKETQNWYLFPAILFALAMAFLWLYIPQLYPIVGTTPVPVEYWFLPFSFGIVIILLDEARKYCVRRWPSGVAARAAW